MAFDETSQVESLSATGKSSIDSNPSAMSHFRKFANHPRYKQVAPILSALRRFGPALNALSLIIGIGSLIVAAGSLAQSRDIYIRSLRPVLAITISSPQKGAERSIVITNASQADAHELTFACRRVPAWVNIYAAVPLIKKNGTSEIVRGESTSFPIAGNCLPFDPGQQPATFNDGKTILLPMFVCYQDEMSKSHAIVRFLGYKPNVDSYQTLPVDSLFAKQFSTAAKEQCGAIPSAS